MTLDGPILLTGATGCVGGRLLTALLAAGHRVRCLASRPDVLRSRLGGAVEVMQGDVLNAETLPAALEGVYTAYYLVRSMMRGARFEAGDRLAAANFARAARQAGVRRDPEQLRPGDALAFWWVEAYEPDRAVSGRPP